MRIEDATQTVGGHPVRIYATDGGGWFPVHGAIWENKDGPWLVYRWRRDGVGEEHKEQYNLQLHDWRDEIPWSALNPDISCVVRDQSGNWIGLNASPLGPGARSWTLSGDLHVVYPLTGFKISNAPADWREAIAKRPEI